MFANYPLVVQILGWGVFMGLNGYIGAVCPGLNLAVLALVGLFASRKIGIALLVVAIIITFAESMTYVFNHLSADGLNQSHPTFIAQGMGVLNLTAAGIVLFMLLSHFSNLFPLPKYLTITIVVLFYVAGVWAGVTYWVPLISHGILVAAVGLLIALCYMTSAPVVAIVMGALAFLILSTLWRFGLVEIGYQIATIDSRFLKAVSNNQREQIVKLWKDTNFGLRVTALDNALTTKNKDLVRFLIQQDMTIEIDYTMGGSLYEKDLDAVKMLVEAGGTIKPIYVEKAVDHNFLSAVQFFVDNGVDVNQKDHRPLSKACKEGHIEIAEYLLKTGKNSQETLDEALVELCSSVDYRDNETAEENLAKILLEHGANPNYKTNKGQTALQKARAKNHQKIVKLLKSYGAKE